MRCHNCGAEVAYVIGYFTEMVFGTCRVVDDGIYEDFDTHDSDDFTINEYMCPECEEVYQDLEDFDDYEDHEMKVDVVSMISNTGKEEE